MIWSEAGKEKRKVRNSFEVCYGLRQENHMTPFHIEEGVLNHSGRGSYRTLTYLIHTTLLIDTGELSSDVHKLSVPEDSQ